MPRGEEWSRKLTPEYYASVVPWRVANLRWLRDELRAWRKRKGNLGTAFRKVLRKAKKALNAGRMEDALTLAAMLGRMTLFVDLQQMAAWEDKRKAALQTTNDEKRTQRQSRVKLARELLAEFAADVKTMGCKAVHKQIGEIMQERLELDEPVPAETVRSYLKPKKTGKA